MTTRITGATLFLLLSLLGCRQAERWNVLLVTFDTTRADHIGSHGSPSVTPNLDAVTAEGTRFAHAYSVAPITAPSHSTILTGKYPIAHGFRDNALFVLDDRHQTLAEVLSTAGYATAASIGSFPLLARWGFDQGFDLYDDHITGAWEDKFGARVQEKKDIYFDERPAAAVNEAIFPWLGERGSDPFFLWLHYFDPHQPWEAPAPYDQLYAADPYRAEIAYADEAFGNIVRRLKEQGQWDRTIVVFTSDHGEGLGEHNESTHSMLLYDSTLHVPLVVRVPGMPGGQVIERRVSLVDLVPTLLDLVGISVPEGVQGRSLAESIRKGDEPQSTPIYAETLSPRLAQGWGELRALIDGHAKFIYGPRPELFDLELDPRELADRTAEDPETAEQLQRRLAAFLREHAATDLAAPAQLDTETRERLEALGYLTAGSETDEPIVDELRPGGIAPQDHALDITKVSLAKALMAQGQPLRARPILAELLEGSPESPLYIEVMLTAEVRLGNIEGALELLETSRATFSDETSARMYQQVARAVAAVGDFEKSLELIRKAIGLRPTADAHYLEAGLLKTLERGAERFAALEAALALDPNHVSSRVAYAVDLIERGRTDEGESHLLQAMLDYPLYAKAYFNYGMLAQQMGVGDIATQNFERAIRLDPAYTLARRALVALLLELGDRERASAEFKILQRLAPDSPDTLAAAELINAEAGP